MMSLNNLIQSSANLELAKRSLLSFVQYVKKDYVANWHHELLCEYLDRVASGQIKRLMVFMPPQHGKSELVSRNFPAYLLGLNPNLKIVGASYSADLSRQFNRSVQRIIDSNLYSKIFPKTKLNNSNIVTPSKGVALRNADIFETLDFFGFYKSVGVGGSLTGTPADIAIIDDPVKDAVQATSPTYQKRVFEWYDQVLETRLHNDSSVVITMTRWDKGDLAGRLLELQKDWEVLILEGLKERVLHPKDPRNIGEALWGNRHSLERLSEKKLLSERTFNALYQQRPDRSAKGLVFPFWQVVSDEKYESLDSEVIYGLDFGFSSDPVALVELKIIGNDVYCKEIIYSTGLTNADLVNIIDNFGVNKYAYMYADSASPDRIEEIRRAKYNIHPCVKGKDSIIAGILKINEYTLHICQKSVNLQNEINQYRYKEDINGDPLPSVFSGNDHALDAMRYAIYTHYINIPQKITFAKNVKNKIPKR
jgi:hypothetical protein